MKILLPFKYRCCDHLLIKGLILFNLLAAEIPKKIFFLSFFFSPIIFLPYYFIS